MRRKTNDIIVVVLFLAVGICLLAMMSVFSKDGRSVKVYIDNRLCHTFDINEDRELVISTEKGENTLVIKDGYAFVSHADCPDKTCVNTGKINMTTQVIACMPHGLVITVEE